MRNPLKPLQGPKQLGSRNLREIFRKIIPGSYALRSWSLNNVRQQLPVSDRLVHGNSVGVAVMLHAPVTKCEDSLSCSGQPLSLAGQVGVPSVGLHGRMNGREGGVEEGRQVLTESRRQRALGLCSGRQLPVPRVESLRSGGLLGNTQMKNWGWFPKNCSEAPSASTDTQYMPHPPHSGCPSVWYHCASLVTSIPRGQMLGGVAPPHLFSMIELYMYDVSRLCLPSIRPPILQKIGIFALLVAYHWTENHYTYQKHIIYFAIAHPKFTYRKLLGMLCVMFV